jgi:hypothetical protein
MMDAPTIAPSGAKPRDRSAEAVDRILRDFDVMESKRGIWEQHWEQVALKVLPYYSTSFYSRGNVVPGQKRSQDQFDVTANAALWKFAAAMESMITPANGKWHRMRPLDAALMKDRQAALWYDQLNDALFRYRYSPHSGFQAQAHDGYVSIGAFGTSCLFTDEFNDPTQPWVRGLRYKQIFLGEVFFAVNHQGQVDKVGRRFKMTLRQIAQKWPDKLPENLRGKLNTNPEEEVVVIHMVQPNVEFDPGMTLSWKSKRFSSHYILRETRTLLGEGGYRCNPYSIPRYLTAPGELYGRSPAMNVLPGINVLNEMKKTLLKQGHRAVDPILLAHDDGIMDGMSLKPGAVNYGAVNADGRPLVHALQTGNVAVGKDMMDDERLAINDAFLVTLFQILIDTPQMTATEVLERAREKGALLSPTMGRHQSEGIGPMIEREVDLLLYQGLVPPPPPSVREAGGQYRVEYDAPLNRMMRSEEAAGAMRTFQWAAEVAAQTQDPSPLDWFDVDVMIPEISDINGMPFRYLRDADTVAQVRQGRQSDKETAQLTQALPGMAAMTKAASPEGTNPNAGQPGA